MPRVKLIDTRGMGYQCDTLDVGRLEGWLGEWLPRIHDPRAPTRMEVWPLPALDGTWDWPTGPVDAFRWFNVDTNPKRALAQMDAERRRLAAELAERSPKP